MAFRDYFYKNPLVVLQIGGWTSYIIIDIFGHLRSGYGFNTESIIYGGAAFILTSCVALLSQRNRIPSVTFQSIYFAFLLYIAAIIWHKLYKIIHSQTDGSFSVKVAKLFDKSLIELLDAGNMPMFLFLAWGGLYVGSKWYLAHQQKQQELARVLLQKRQAQLETLRYQLNPHFLFNVLNSIDVSVMSDDKATAHNMLKHLSGFLRSTLQEGEKDKITLAAEIDIVQNFIAIEQVRYGDAIAIKIDMDEGCRKALLPPMLLQPLVENAIKNAWSQKEKGYVDILISKQTTALSIIIRNNKATDALKPSTGIGLKNTRERLHLVYGKDASISTNAKSISFEVEVKIPWEEQL